MEGIDLIMKYFPQLSEVAAGQFALMGELYPEWNEKINVISRRDIDNLYVNHVLHSLSIAAFWGDLVDGTTVMDLGCGGGFPGLPLAVMYPGVHFMLIDRVGKKLKVAADIAERIGVANVTFMHGDSGECHDKFDYVVSRAVMPLNDLVRAALRNVSVGRRPGNRYDNGIICLKGGDLTLESVGIPCPIVEYGLPEFLPHPAYDTKKLIYIPVVATNRRHKR